MINCRAGERNASVKLAYDAGQADSAGAAGDFPCFGLEAFECFRMDVQARAPHHLCDPKTEKLDVPWECNAAFGVIHFQLP